MSHFVEPSLYIKSKDPFYIGLLRLACISDFTHYDRGTLEDAINTFNQIPNYFRVHWRLMPLLYAKANLLGVFPQLEPKVQRLLKDESRKGIITELAKKHQLDKIVELFRSENIPVILLKSTAFANQLYSSNSPRLSNDIDLLVRNEDWEKAQSCLKGFMDYSPKLISGALDDDYEVSFKPRSETGAVVDLHIALIHPLLGEICEKELWDESEKHKAFNSSLVRTLSAEHAFIHQAIHAFKDSDFSKYNLVDCNELIFQHQLCWEKIVRVSRSWAVENTVFFIVFNLNKHMGLELTNDAIGRLRPNVLKYKLIKYVSDVGSRSTINGRKTIKYRLLQIIEQLAFITSVKSLVRYWLFFLSTELRNN